MEMDSTSSRHSPRSGNKLDGWASATPNPATMPPVIQSRKMAIKLILEAKDDMPLMSPSYSMTQNYGGKLHDDDAAVKETTPHVKDRRRFQASLQEVSSNLVDFLANCLITCAMRCRYPRH